MIGKDTSPNVGSATRFKPGQSGNPKGRPKGSTSLKTVIRKITEDEGLNWNLVPIKNNKELAEKYGNNAWLAIVYVAIGKAMTGDIGAMEWLRKSQYGNQPNLKDDDIPTQPLIVYDFNAPEKSE